MRCPFCHHADSRVIDSREIDDGQGIRRRRSCTECARRFTTVEEAVLAVVKRSGVTEPFSRAKVITGVRRACQGRPVDEDALALLAQQVEDAVRSEGAAEVPSQQIGLAILGPLRDLDEVAYLRFASVYRAFTSADDFAAEIAALRSDHTRHGGTAEPDGSGVPDGSADPDDSGDPDGSAGSADPDGDRGNPSTPTRPADAPGDRTPDAAADVGPPGQRQPMAVG